jgi:two-component system, cell cycle sensor histidine kinase and response regulator CckA
MPRCLRWGGGHSFLPIGDPMEDDSKTKKQLIHEPAASCSQKAAPPSIENITRYTQLEEDNKLLAAIVQFADDAIIVKDLEGIIISWNHGAEVIYGYTAKEAVGRSISLIMPPDAPDDYKEILAKIVRGESIDHYETQRKRKDGRIIDVSVSISPVKDASGKIISASIIARDITERKRMESLLRASEEQYRRLFETAHDGIMLLEKGEGRITHMNPATEKMLGYTREESIGKKLQDIGVSIDMGDFKTIIQKLDEDGIIKYTDVPAKTKSGRSIDTDIYLVDRAVSVQCNIRDVTERKRAEEDLRQAEERYRSIFENAQEGIFQSTREGRFITINPAMAHIHGYESPEEMMASVTNIEEQLYLDPDERKRYMSLLEDSGTISNFEMRSTKKDGTVIWIKLNAHKVVRKDSGGEAIFYEGTAEDVTVRKQSEEALTRLESQLFQSQKMEAIGTLAGGIAHDFNNLLTVISGFSSLLKMSMRKNDPKMAYLNQILLSSEKAAQLTKGLLAFSRKQEITLQPLNVNNTIKATLKLLKRILTEDIELKIKLSKENIIIMADPTQIDQILFNLTSNARDVMPHGGTLIIETKVVELNDESIDSHGYGAPGEYVLLSVTDTGSGMDEATKERIFEPFFTTKEVGRGTGLGLSTVYGIVKQHNGYITVYSEPNIGTTFHVYFPVANEISEEDEDIQLPVKGGDETILIAEDSEGVRLLISRVLTENGYTTIEAVDGADAVEKFKNARSVDLLIFDSVMPKKNGRETYDEIEKINPGMKVIFTSGYTKDVFLDKGIQDEKFNFLQKPISPDALLRKVREVLDDRGDSY